MNTKKGIAPVAIAVVVALLLGIGGYVVVKQRESKKTEITNQNVVDPIVGQPCSGGVMGGGIWTSNGPLPSGYICDFTGVEKGGEGKLAKTDGKTSTNTQISVADEAKVKAVARKVLEALNARDYQKLEELVSPDGLSLGKEPNVDYINNLIVKNDVSEIPKDTKVYFWGYTDGKGDPINFSRVAFINGFIYSGTVDYLKAPDVAVNKTLGKGNSFNTMDKAALNGYTYVAFHFSGFDEKYGGMDWTTIYLVFDSVNGEYKLRGIAKDNWTI